MIDTCDEDCKLQNGQSRRCVNNQVNWCKTLKYCNFIIVNHYMTLASEHVCGKDYELENGPPRWFFNNQVNWCMIRNIPTLELSIKTVTRMKCEFVPHHDAGKTLTRQYDIGKWRCMWQRLWTSEWAIKVVFNNQVNWCMIRNISTSSLSIKTMACMQFECVTHRDARLNPKP